MRPAPFPLISTKLMKAGVPANQPAIFLRMTIARIGSGAGWIGSLWGVTERKARPAPTREPKRRGELAELAFALKATSLGFAVAKPYGDSERYDFVLDNGKRLVRVQVKSATRCDKYGAYFITAHRSSNATATPYTVSEIDFLVAHVCPEDAWFVIPVEAFVPRTSLHVFGKDRGECGLFWRYREAWELMRG
jgi:hypothetical protein